jgi:transcriptional antiterminator RfaH
LGAIDANPLDTEVDGMPDIAELTSLYPATLLDQPAWEPDEVPWWVLYTKVNQERMLARHLLGCQIGFYLPLVPKASLCRGRRVVCPTPLFASYLFMRGTEEDRVTALTSNRISRILPVADPAVLVGDLRQLHRLIDSGVPLTAERRLAPGCRVRVRQGPLSGIEGTILRRQGATRLLVAVSFLQQGASVDIEDCLLEPIP